MTDDTAARAEIQKLLTANVKHITRNLITFWHRWADDMVKAGVDRGEVANSMITVAVGHCLKSFGRYETARLLALVIELNDELGDKPYPDEPRH